MRHELNIGSALHKQGKFRTDRGKNHAFTVLDLRLGGTVNGADCRPRYSARTGLDGAIAQLGERIVRNDEVGGSIPPGSTTLRPLGYAWRSRAEPKGRSVVPGIARRATTGFFRKLATPPPPTSPPSACAQANHP